MPWRRHISNPLLHLCKTMITTLIEKSWDKSANRSSPQWNFIRSMLSARLPPDHWTNSLFIGQQVGVYDSLCIKCRRCFQTNLMCLSFKFCYWRYWYRYVEISTRYSKRAITEGLYSQKGSLTLYFGMSDFHITRPSTKIFIPETFGSSFHYISNNLATPSTTQMSLSCLVSYAMLSV